MKNEKGFTLIEVLVSLALLGIIGSVFLGGLATASKSIFIADKQTTAESLARSQMEYVKEQDYSSAPWDYELPSSPPSWDLDHELPEGCDGYTANVSAELLHDTDDGIQQITVTVSHGGEAVIILEGYKVFR